MNATLRFRRLAIDRAPALEVEHLNFTRRSARLALPDVWRRRLRRIVARAGRDLRFVARQRNAVPLVEALIRRRPATFPLESTEVPFSKQRRRVAERLERFGDRGFPQRDARWLRGAAADGVSASHERRARHGARELDVEVRQPDSFRTDAIDVWRGYTAHGSIRTDFTPAEVVGEHEDDVGSLLSRRRGALRDDDGGECEQQGGEAT
jgi:hypothetical protein